MVERLIIMMFKKLRHCKLIEKKKGSSKFMEHDIEFMEHKLSTIGKNLNHCSKA